MRQLHAWWCSILTPCLLLLPSQHHHHHHVHHMQVVAIASLQPTNATAQQAVVATGRIDVLLAGCGGGDSSAAATAAVASVRLARRRSPHWVVSIATEPDTANDTWSAADSSLQVVSTWRQEAGPDQLAATGEVRVKGAPGITRVKVRAGVAAGGAAAHRVCQRQALGLVRAPTCQFAGQEPNPAHLVRLSCFLPCLCAARCR